GLFHPFQVDAFKIAVSDQPPLEFADKDALAIIGTGFEGDKFNLIALAGVPIQVDGGTIIDGPSEGTGLDVLSVDGEGLNYRVTSSSVTEATGQRNVIDYVRIEGLVVSNGTFVLSDNDVPLNVEVNDGATFAGQGAVRGTLALNAGGTLAPGLISPGFLTTGNVVFSAGSTFDGDLNGTTPAVLHDQVAVTGTVDLGDAALVAKLGYAPDANDRLVLISNDGDDPITGSFKGLPEGARLQIDGKLFRISYRGGDGNDVELTAT